MPAQEVLSVAPSDYDEEEEEEEDVVYNTEDFISKPFFSPACTMSPSFFTFAFSYGFESVRRYNICLADDEHVIHWSGAIMTVVNMETLNTTFRRCCDQGFGFITKHPHLPYLAVGEKGHYPYIIIYEWPNFNVIQVMKRGTKVAYSFLDFSPDGELLASQGAAPDFTLTLWHWEKGWVILRCKAHTQEVYRSEFSRHFPGRLISSGSGHIKFWTMADTFTGLKLQGKLAKFGKTPISDTTCFYGLADGLVISAAENGNMLIWESCQIKMEVVRGKSDFCHNGVINFFEFDNESGDLFTLGSEGKMRCWEFASILKGKPKGDRKYVSGLASYEMDIKDEFGIANTKYVIKMSNDPESPLFHNYVAQDSRGSVWKLDLNLKGNQEPPLRLFLKHKGQIAGMGTSPGDYYIATLGFGGKLMVHNAQRNKLILAKQFFPNGSAMLWLPGTMVVILGFSNGVLRLVVLCLRQADAKPKLDKLMNSKFAACIQAIKPHANRISCISLKHDGNILATGSDDSTIFVYRIAPYRDYVKLIPVGLMVGPGPIYSLTWKVGTDEVTVIGCCTNGVAIEAVFEGIQEVKPSEKYLNPVEVRKTVFKSVKSEIIRDTIAKAVATRKSDKLAKKKENLVKMKEENPALLIDEAVFLQDSDEEEELPPLFYPAKPCTIYFARYIDGRYWLSPSGYDAGFLYLYYLGSEAPNECIPIADAEDIDISACEDILDGKYIFLGLGNGKIRVLKIDPARPFDFSDYLEMAMHDCQQAKITKICFSHDLRYVYSCGTDSNIFSYTIALEGHEYLSRKNLPPLMPIPEYAIDGKIPDDQPSLQEINATAKLKELEGEAAEMMELKIKELLTIGQKIDELWELNDLLPKDKRLSVTDMELHPKFTRCLKEEFDEKLAIWEKKLQFGYEKAKLLYRKVYQYYMRPIKTLDVNIKCLKNKGSVKTFRVREISSRIEEAEKFVKHFLGKRQEDKRSTGAIMVTSKPEPERKKVVEKLPALDPNLNKYVPLLSPQEKILYDSYEKRREERASLLKEIEQQRPDDEDDSILDNPAATAKQGRKLKTDPTFRLPFSKRITKQLKLVHVIRSFSEINELKEEFNAKVLNLRDLKTKEMSKFRHNTALHKKMVEFIPEEEALELPKIPPVDLKNEYPNLYYTAKLDPTTTEESDKMEVNHPDLDIIDPQVIRYYNNTNPKSADLQEYYDFNIHPAIIRLKKLQEKMIFETNSFMESFDNQVDQLISDKMDCAYICTQKELYVGTLIQEMSIISRYQFLEELTQRAMRSYLAIKVIYNFKLFVRKKRIARKENHIEMQNDKIRDIVNEFQNLVTSSKYAKHLTNIFKKKYKAPKIDDDGDSESESSSSEDESSSEKEDEEEEMAAYKFDETICPDGCDPYVFNRTFKLRQARHEYEAKILTSRKEIAANQHEMVGMKRILKTDSVLLAIYQLQLDRISREKQAELNQVSTLLIVDSSQIQNWHTEKKVYIHPKDLVVASVKAIKDLKESRRNLSITTAALRNQSKEHNLHKMHLKKDIIKFEEIHKQLLAERKETLIQKFGIETNVYALDVEATRRLLLSKAYDVVLDERFGLIKQLKDRMFEEKEKLAALKKMHANNLFTLAAIESEKYKAIKDERKLKKKHLHEYINEEQLDSDLKNLDFILCQQKALKERLKNEIRYLKFKDQGPVAKATALAKETISEKTSEISVVISSAIEEISEVEQLSEITEEEHHEEGSGDHVGVTESETDQDEINFEYIFKRILKQVIPSETLITEETEEESFNDEFTEEATEADEAADEHEKSERSELQLQETAGISGEATEGDEEMTEIVSQDEEETSVSFATDQLDQAEMKEEGEISTEIKADQVSTEEKEQTGQDTGGEQTDQPTVDDEQPDQPITTAEEQADQPITTAEEQADQPAGGDEQIDQLSTTAEEQTDQFPEKVDEQTDQPSTTPDEPTDQPAIEDEQTDQLSTTAEEQTDQHSQKDYEQTDQLQTQGEEQTEQQAAGDTDPTSQDSPPAELSEETNQLPQDDTEHKSTDAHQDGTTIDENNQQE